MNSHKKKSLKREVIKDRNWNFMFTRYSFFKRFFFQFCLKITYKQKLFIKLLCKKKVNSLKTHKITMTKKILFTKNYKFPCYSGQKDNWFWKWKRYIISDITNEIFETISKFSVRKSLISLVIKSNKRNKTKQKNYRICSWYEIQKQKKQKMNLK